MFNRIRDRFGTAGLIVSIMALVLALAGGAFAASGLNSKQKKQVKAIAKQFAGKPGATGPAGPAGPTGANGKDGTNGTNGTNGRDGTNGTNGQSVTVADEPAFANCGDATGYKLTSVSGTDYVCNGLDGRDGRDGRDGSPWVVGTAPSGATMKGTWAVHANALAADEEIPLAISTGVPVSSFAGLYVPTAAQNDPNQPFGCTGNADNPTPTSLAPGFACVYEKSSTNLTPWSGPGNFGAVNPSNGGGNVFLAKATASGLVDGYGTWAITLP